MPGAWFKGVVISLLIMKVLWAVTCNKPISVLMRTFFSSKGNVSPHNIADCLCNKHNRRNCFPYAFDCDLILLLFSCHDLCEPLNTVWAKTFIMAMIIIHN